MSPEILFNNGEPVSSPEISQAIDHFGASYNRTVCSIILSTARDSISRSLFFHNTISILNNFKMTRNGVFKGLRIGPEGKPIGPIEKIEACWNAIRPEIIEIKELLNKWSPDQRERVLVLVDDEQLQIISDSVYAAFKKLLPETMSQHSYGLVGASKILFAIFPEIVLPVDNAEWKQLFRTVDLGDVIRLMAKEIKAWESSTSLKLNECDHTNATTTLPAVYNVMAMEART